MITIDSATGRRVARSISGLPCDAEGPVFREPWEAQAFAMVVTLHERGLFGWDEWAAMLSEEIRAAQGAGDPDTGETYYRHWLAALERMVARKGIADRAALARHRDAWGLSRRSDVFHSAELTGRGKSLADCRT